MKTIETCACYSAKKNVGCFALDRRVPKIKACDGRDLFCPFYKSMAVLLKKEAECKARAEVLGFEFTPASHYRKEFL